MLVETAIADAYGSGFEYADENLPPTPFSRPRRTGTRKPRRKCNDLSRYVKHPRYTLEPGQYTDDTQMSVALAECLLSGDPWDPPHIVKYFFDAFKRDPRPGYAQGFYDFLCRVESPEQFLAEIISASDKSGGAMRAPVIGLVPDIGRVIQLAETQAKITHDTPVGIAGARVAACATHYFHYCLGPKNELGAWLEEILPALWLDDITGNPDDADEHYAWDRPWRGRVRAWGYMAPHAAVTAIMKYASLSDILRACVDYGGDTDTVAAIAVAAASRSIEVEQDLPQVLYDGLENGPYGLDYLRELDRRLLARFPGAK